MTTLVRRWIGEICNRTFHVAVPKNCTLRCTPADHRRIQLAPRAIPCSLPPRGSLETSCSLVVTACYLTPLPDIGVARHIVMDETEIISRRPVGHSVPPCALAEMLLLLHIACRGRSWAVSQFALYLSFCYRRDVVSLAGHAMCFLLYGLWSPASGLLQKADHHCSIEAHVRFVSSPSKHDCSVDPNHFNSAATPTQQPASAHQSNLNHPWATKWGTHLSPVFACQEETSGST